MARLERLSALASSPEGRDWIEQLLLQAKLTAIVLKETAEQLAEEGSGPGQAALADAVDDFSSEQTDVVGDFATELKIIETIHVYLRCVLIAELVADLREWGFGSSADLLDELAVFESRLWRLDEYIGAARDECPAARLRV